MMTIRSPKWINLATSTSHKHFSPNLGRYTAVSLAQPNDDVEHSLQSTEKSDLKIFHISFYMILDRGDTMEDDEGANNAEFCRRHRLG